MKNLLSPSDINHKLFHNISLEKSILESTTPLPGCIPYENRREIRIKKKYDGFDLKSFLSTKFPHIDFSFWQASTDDGRLLRNGNPLNLNQIVRSGNILIHIVPNTVEPVVNNKIKVLYNDSEIIAINKPSPLPVHPSGRYNKNTLISFLTMAMPTLKYRIVHRLDSDTTGIMIVAKSKDAARKLRCQFNDHRIDRRYFALINPIPEKMEFHCSARISTEPSSGGYRKVEESALAADTYFKVLDTFNDNTALVQISPKSGRTNQIRLHLHHLGFQIVGDRAYTKESLSPSEIHGCKNKLHLHSSMIQFHHPAKEIQVKLLAPHPSWLKVRLKIN